MTILTKHNIRLPGLIVTDRELALLNALEASDAWCPVPHLLCRWHVNMNVLAKTRRFFPPAIKQGGEYHRHPKFKAFLKEWNALLSASTPEAYEQLLASFKAVREHPEEAVKYAVNVWLTPWKVRISLGFPSIADIEKEKLVTCWTNQVPHMGHITTSAVESSHSSIKKYLVTSRGDLKSVFERLVLF